MKRILLICPEPLAHGQPAGVGIRFLEMARVLAGDGHRLTLLSPDGGGPEGCERLLLEPAALLEASGRSDVAVVQGHAANAFFAHARPIPTVVDLYDPFIIENLHYHADRGNEVFGHDHATLMESLLRGDFFLCASEAQRMFYLGLLLACGRLNPVVFANSPRLASLLAVAPFGVHPARPHVPRDLDAPAILFGGIYDWYDPIAAIQAVHLVRESVPGATLTFTKHPNPEITPQGKLAEAMQYVRTRGLDFVRFVPWSPYENRAPFFETFALALVTFRRSIETDLSMRTRIYDYLWCGLPIISSSAPGTDQILEHYGAGSVIPIEAPAAFAREIVAVVRDRSRYDAMAAGTERFVSEHQWDHTLAPLREFCLAPKADRTKELYARRSAVASLEPSVIGRLQERWRRMRQRRNTAAAEPPQ